MMLRKGSRTLHLRKLVGLSAQVRLWVSCHALQLWMGAAFPLMGLIAFASEAPRYAAAWPFLFIAAGTTAFGSILRPEARRLVAASGTLIVLVSASRIAALVEFFWPLAASPLQAIHVLLWGLYVVMGLRWPQVVHDAALRYAVESGREVLGRQPAPQPPLES